MEPFRTLTALAVPLDRANVDTDQIIPKQFLKRIERTGYGGKNGIVLARISETQVATLLNNAKTIPNYQLTVSLEAQTVTDNQGFSATFEIDPFRKFCLLEGLDDIGLTLRHEAALDTFETKHDQANWLKAK